MGLVWTMESETAPTVLCSLSPNHFQLPDSSCAMAMKLAPLVQTGIGTDAGSFPRIPPPRRPSAASSIRSSPSSSFAGVANEFPPPLLSNAQRRVRDLLWHGGGLSLGIDLGDARTGIAVGRGITLPRPLTVLKLRGQKLELMLRDLARQQVPLCSLRL
ncbi:hypothetical protein PR202_ga07790 [Eleusine coracana subsp. coracana]|uniref:YqgF/RNase H-like domain-containing protein n=1 Tax=Eleusine coracana subsp. coracana TaxID=191504 RepID=A0AAV5BYE9_ELECO|nr:hypothetical protein PR202_ga07790 [Eleusine coracana subsp. coracana]